MDSQLHRAETSPEASVLLGQARAGAPIQSLIARAGRDSRPVRDAADELVDAGLVGRGSHRPLPFRRADTIQMLRSGTRNVWITDAGSPRIPQMRHHMQILAGHGEQIHTAASNTQRLFVFDRRLALIPLNSERHRDGALMTSNPSIVGSLVALFHEILEHSALFSLVPLRPVLERTILELLATGAKDEAIARKLGVSARTVRRSVTSLMAECGVDSRFQLAIAAVRLGWLSADDLTAKGRPSGPSRE